MWYISNIGTFLAGCGVVTIVCLINNGQRRIPSKTETLENSEVPYPAIQTMSFQEESISQQIAKYSGILIKYFDKNCLALSREINIKLKDGY